jgi:malonyl-CoA O-methyltransferase
MKFNKAYSTYDDHAIIQKIVATNLIKLITNENYYSVLELGCGTGIFTEKLYKNIKFKHLDLNDIFNVSDYIKKFPYRNLILGDMNDLILDKYSLIVSSSSFQWIENFPRLIKKLSHSSKKIVFSMYISGNLKEIKEHFGIELDYLSTKEIKKILKKYFIIKEAKEEEFVLEFVSPLDLLKHLKYTGVTGVGSSSFSKVKTFSSKKLTYKVAYFSCENLIS